MRICSGPPRANLTTPIIRRFLPSPSDYRAQNIQAVEAYKEELDLFFQDFSKGTKSALPGCCQKQVFDKTSKVIVYARTYASRRAAAGRH